MTNKIQKYKKGFDYSYISGAYATTELLKCCPECIIAIYFRSTYRVNKGIESLCANNNVPCLCSDRIFTTTNQKENVYVISTFRKFSCVLSCDQPHIVLVNPSDMGNLGTIVRTIVGHGFYNLAIIEPAADIWHPKTLRASMGAIFHISHEYFSNFDDYVTRYPDHELFIFTPGGTTSPALFSPDHQFSLVFGNEANGLDQSFDQLGQSVTIPMSGKIDSFNLAVAVGIGTYMFKNDIKQRRE